jgi:Putative MetA-pathway of phenol degradation
MRHKIITLALSTAVVCANPSAQGDAPETTAVGHNEASLLFVPAPLTEPLVTDRPDFTESTDAVPRGHFQIEAGYTYSHDSTAGGTGSHTAGEVLLRIGLLNDVELRIEWPNFERLAVAGASTTGLSDIGIGFKYKLVEQRGMRPHFGVIGQIRAPTGSASFSSEGVDPAVKLLWAYDVTERVSIAGNVNLESVTESSNRVFQMSASGSIGLAVTEEFGAYVEYFGFYPVDQGADTTHFVNTGLTYLITNNFQLDARVGVGLNGRAEDVFVGFGFSWRK